MNIEAEPPGHPDAVARRKLPRVPTQSRRQHVVEILRDAILRGDYAPGDKLTEAELSEQLGASRAPVREALRELEYEGLIASLPYRGTKVLGVTQEEIEQVLVPVRVILERFAFLKSMDRLTDELIEDLQGMVDDMAAAAEHKNSDLLAELDVQFHRRVIEASEMHHCLQIWQTIQPRVQAYFRRDASKRPHAEAVSDQHQVLLDALVSRDPDLLATTIEQHIHTYAGTPQ